MTTPIFIPMPIHATSSDCHDSGTAQINFFCATEEHKTELQMQYCEQRLEQAHFEGMVVTGFLGVVAVAIIVLIFAAVRATL